MDKQTEDGLVNVLGRIDTKLTLILELLKRWEEREKARESNPS